MDYKLEELLDISLMQQLQEKLNLIYSLPSAIIDTEGKILTSVAWQDVCTKFHRIHPDCERECLKSNQYINEHLHEANPSISYKCPLGLTNNATPIIIKEKHLGTFFTGQFFLEKPDIEGFKKQAMKYGFNEQSYLEAVAKIPVWTEVKLIQYLDFIKIFVEMIAGFAIKNLRMNETNMLIKESEKFNRTILQCTSDWIWEIDNEGKYCYCSGKVEQILGYTSEEIIGKTPFDLMPEGENEKIKEIYKKISETKSTIVDFENWNLHKDGHLVCLLTNGYPIFDENGYITGYRGADKDITERKISERKIKNLNQLYSILNIANHTFQHIHNSQILFNEACSIAVEKGDFRMAWIGLLDENTKKITPVASAGYTNGYLENINIDLNEELLSAGPCGLAVKTGIYQVVTDIETNPDMILWRERAIKNGYSSSASFPLKVFGKIIGAFSLYADKTYFFNTDENNLLELFSKDISKTLEINEIESQKKISDQQLKESETKYRSIFENILDVFYQIDLNGIIVEMSPSISSLCEYDRNEVIGTDVRNYYYYKMDRDEFLNSIKQAGSVLDYELCFRTKSGNPKFTSVSARLVYDTDDKPSHIEGVLRDITERKQTEALLKNEKDRMSVIIKGTQSGTWEWNIQTGEAIFNERWAEIIGYTLEELSPVNIQTWNRLSHPDDLKLSDSKLKQHFKGEIDYYECEVRLKHKNGHWIWVLDRGMVNKRDKNGQPLIMSGTHQDITERKQIEASLIESNKRLQNIFNNLQDAFLQTDIDSKITVVSTSAISMFGYSDINQIIGLPAENMYANPKDRERLMVLLSEHGSVKDFICEGKRKDGSTFWASLNIHFQYDENGKFSGSHGVVRDISKVKL